MLVKILFQLIKERDCGIMDGQQGYRDPRSQQPNQPSFQQQGPNPPYRTQQNFNQPHPSQQAQGPPGVEDGMRNMQVRRPN